MNPIQNYIEQKKREFKNKFPQVYDGSDICIQNDIESFLTSCIIGVLAVIEQEIDSLYASEHDHGIVQLDKLAEMFNEIRKAV
jgi:hypothetical protein